MSESERYVYVPVKGTIEDQVRQMPVKLWLNPMGTTMDGRAYSIGLVVDRRRRRARARSK